MDRARIATALRGGRASFAALVDEILAMEGETCGFPPFRWPISAEFPSNFRFFPLDLARRGVESGTEALAALSDSVLNPTPSSNGAAEFRLRRHLFEALLSQEDFEAAASVLGSMNMDNVSLSPEELADTYIRVAETYLELDEAVDAEIFASKASPVMANVSDRGLEVRGQYEDVWSLEARWR
eukprot:scaffold285_cov304-Pinguiococcus_pyrenoidosus.AAC.36